MNRKRASLLLLVLTVLETSCAAREKGTVVAVTRSRESVRNCAFAGRVTAADTEERDFLSEGAMR